jgi:hypothetical protein
LDFFLVARYWEKVISQTMEQGPLIEFTAHASGWPVALLELLGPTQTIQVSSGWLVVLIIALWIWRDRLGR